MPQPNQLDQLPEDVHVTARRTCCRSAEGTSTEAGLRVERRRRLQYLEAWLRGIGCVPLFNLMEDAATAEISRAQIWQWVHHGATLDDGRRVTRGAVRGCLAERWQS